MAIINESAARIAKELSSFSDYVEGSATASYNAQCAEAAAILEQVKPKCATADQRERAEWLYNHYCTRCDCEEYDRILTDADSSSRKPGGITVDDLARIAEAIKAVSETDDDVPAIAFALSRRTTSHFEQV